MVPGKQGSPVFSPAAGHQDTFAEKSRPNKDGGERVITGIYKNSYNRCIGCEIGCPYKD
jgi:hypothetical protein